MGRKIKMEMTREDIKQQQERRKQKREKERLKLSMFLTVLAILIVFVVGFFVTKGPESFEEPKHARYSEIEVSDVFVEPGRPNVRSTSRLIASRETAGNSYGRITDRNNTGLALHGVSRIIISDADRVNGPYIGIYVEDLSDELLQFFPRGVLKELPGSRGQDRYPTDGLIWISSKYLSWTPVRTTNNR
jgi:hypothetical protein